ncbi:N-acetylmuramoyl-L-alanine amidase [Maricaulis sp.]|uniref:N-acetylmuramoyl-L-alanine amidase n=1 Tax=Maricaulis sp. TaxID=1486257 RepID=UPI003A93FBD7
MPTPIAAPSPNFNARKLPVTLIVLHYTGMENGPAALERMCDPAAQVSAHYMVETDGRLFQLVDEDERAWHAGVGIWRGERDINSASIGIEIVNGGHDYGLPDFPGVQIARVIALVRDIMARRGIGPGEVIGHSDIAPGRKQDPGEKFPWGALAAAGCARTVVPAAQAGADPQAQLGAIGYGLEAGLPAVVEAFQRRWRPARVDGVIDDETARLIAAVAG